MTPVWKLAGKRPAILSWTVVSIAGDETFRNSEELRESLCGPKEDIGHNSASVVPVPRDVSAVAEPIFANS